MDKILLYCYHYDPVGKKYALMATNLMRIGGVVTVACLSLLVGGLWLKENHHSKNNKSNYFLEIHHGK